MVAADIEYGRLYTPFPSMTRGRAENRRSGWSFTPNVLITTKLRHVTLHRRHKGVDHFDLEP